MNEKFDDEEVKEVWESDFGKLLFNLYTTERNKKRFYFTKRFTIVREMIRTMLDTEVMMEEKEADDDYFNFGSRFPGQ